MTIRLLFLSVLSCVCCKNIRANTSCRIDLQIKGLENEYVIFASEYGLKNLVVDTIALDSLASGVYESKQRLTGGMYVLIFPNQKYVEIVIDNEQFFSILTDTSNYISNMQVEGADETAMFSEYQKKANEYADCLRVNKDIRALDSLKYAVVAFKEGICQHQPETFLAAYLRMQDEATMPEQAQHNEMSRELFKQRYQFRKRHYFDNVNFSDRRLVYTRLFHEKLSFYFNVLLNQNADTICNEIQNLLQQTVINSLEYRCLLNFLNSNYRTLKNEDQEKVMVFLADNYYLNGKAPWADQRFLKILKGRTDALRPSLIGVKAANLVMQKPDKTSMSLYDVKAGKILVLFWSADCNKCEAAIAAYKNIYEQYKSQGFEVFAVYVHADKETLVNYIKANELSWINVYDPLLKSDFAKVYSVDITPKTYLLDKDKKIIAKNITPQQLETYLTGQ